MGWVLGPERKWLLVFLLLLSAGCSRQANIPAAHHGEINIDAVHADSVVPLSGEWAFYWNRLLSPADFQRSPAPEPDGYLMQPGTWNEFSVAGKPVGPFGMATLRLVIHPGAGVRDVALSLPAITRAYRLWIEDRLMSTRGVVGSDPRREGGAPSATVIHFRTDGRPVVIVLQVSNAHLQSPLTSKPITIGPDARIDQQRLAPMRRTLFFAGGLAMIAFYCMAVFAFRRDDHAQLYFGLFVLVWTALILIQYDRDFWWIEILGKEAEPALFRAEYVLLFVSLPLAGAFFQAVYPKDIPAGIAKLAAIIFIPLALAAAMIPYLWLETMATAAYVVIGILVVYLTYKVVRAALRQHEGFVLAGFGFLTVAGLTDMASQMHLIAVGRLYMPFGILAFALSQALHLSQRSARNFQKVEKLSAELDAKNQALQLKIGEAEHLSRQVVRVSEEERRRISQDLHDGICQQLTAARLRFSVLRKQIQDPAIDRNDVAELSSLLEEAVNRAYDMSLGLWPVDTGAAELSTSFEELCRRIARMEHVKVTFRRTLLDCVSRSVEVNRQLYRIAQEALANVVKHARATTADVSLTCSPQGSVVLTVEDDGVGLSDRTMSADGAGLGMRIMEHRAALIGGTLTVAGRSGGGTTIACVVPCATACPFRKETSDA